jgi:uncharacterized protein
MDNAVLLWALSAILVLLGLFGLVMPGMPGAPLLFGGLLLGAWIEDFAYVGTGTLVTLGVMTALTFACDVVGTAFGAKRYGASRQAVIGAMIGTLVGLLFGLFGILLGPFVGAVCGELMMRKDLEAATRAGWGATIGLALAAAAKLALGFAMIGVFLVVRFF